MSISVVKQMIKRYFSDGVSKSAAELAYFLLFAFFPMIMFVNSIIGIVNIPEETLYTITRIFPTEIQELIANYVSYITDVPTISPLIIGVFLTLYFFTRSMNSLIHTINRVYHLKNRKNGIKQMLISLGFTTGLMVSVILNFILIVIGRLLMRVVKHYFIIPDFINIIIQLTRFVVPIAFVFIYLLMLNYIVPNVKLKVKNAVPGTVFSLLVWAVASSIFAYYIDNMSRYSILYGSLAVIMILMLWLYITGVIIIMGAQLNHILLKENKN